MTGEHPVTGHELYVTRAQLAAIMAVHVKTIDRLVKEGLPSETWGMRARRFLPSEALAWARLRPPSPMRRPGGDSVPRK